MPRKTGYLAKGIDLLDDGGSIKGRKPLLRGEFSLGWWESESHKSRF